MRILLIEDNEDDAYLIRELLEERKEVRFDLEWADRLGKGLTSLATGKIDMVLLDLSLPDSHGLDTFDRVHAHGHDLPTVVLTGLNDEAVALQAMRSGAQDYLVKGRLDGDTLVRAIRYAIERKHAEEALRKSEAQLRQAQKVESIGQLAGGIAHDFNNLLTVINSYSDMLLSETGHRSPLRRGLTEIKEAGQRAATLTRQLLAFSRQQVLTLKVLDLNAVVQNIMKLLRRLIGEDINLSICPDPHLGRVKSDPGQIEQVIMNLAVNARDAMPQGGQLTIETTNVVLDDTSPSKQGSMLPGPYVMLAVSDTGCGMDADTQARIFEPFFTTKEPGRGTGLGLSTVYGIVKQSGGRIDVSSELGRGTTFKIYLPRVEDEVELSEPAPARPEVLRGTETILLVEDDEMVRALGQTILQLHGYTILEARNAKDALHLAEEHQGPIHLLLTDTVMPGPSGPELAERLASIRPETKVLYTSGYTDKVRTHQHLMALSAAFLQKPFTPETLTRKVREVLNRRPEPIKPGHR